tara:strand:+ start:142 stop:534 length:393 start_codon:yes stop_codon:yes gene_type:complete
MYSLDNDSYFNFKKIIIKGDNELSNFIESNLERYNSDKSDKEVTLEINVDYKKLSQSKDLTGTTTDYLLVAEVTFDVLLNNEVSKVNIKKDFIMKDMDKEFEERSYERTIKQNFAYSIVNKLIIQLSKSR